MSILVWGAVALVSAGLGYVGFEFYTKHWNLDNITADLDALVKRLEAHVDFKSRQATTLRAKAAAATSQAQEATASAVQASKIAQNVKELLGK